MFTRQKFAMYLAELMGVMVLITAVYSMAARNTLPFYSSVIAGGVVALLVNTIGATSGAHVNPAITIGLWTIKKIKTSTALMYLVFQIAGGFLAWGLITKLVGVSLNNVAGDPILKVAVAEGIGGLIFGFGVASAIYQNYEGGRLSFTIGASLTAGLVVASLASNAVVNPAVAIGLRSVNLSYILGPIAGSIIGMNLYALLFADVTEAKRSAAASSWSGRLNFRSMLPRRRSASKVTVKPVAAKSAKVTKAKKAVKPAKRTANRKRR